MAERCSLVRFDFSLAQQVLGPIHQSKKVKQVARNPTPAQGYSTTTRVSLTRRRPRQQTFF